jgi:hypothetical protein
MTPDDLSPMLSQPADADNAPMISGRGTKIIADARGAYLAGNMYALFDLMNEEQRCQFNRGCLKHLIDLAYREIVAHGITDREQRVFDAFYAGFQDSADNDIRELLRTEGYVLSIQRRGGEGEPIRDRIIRVIGRCLIISGSTPIYSAFGQILSEIRWNVGNVSSQTAREYQKALLQWELDSAWGVLHGRPPMPFDFRDGL